FSGHVKLSLTSSDVAFLEATPSEPNIKSRSSTSLTRSDLPVNLILNCIADRYVFDECRMNQILGVLTILIAISTRDWYRLHGEKLTRALRALLNVPNILRSFDTFEFDFLGILKRFKFNGKYLFTSDGPILNEEIPRTPETKQDNLLSLQMLE
ncbi:unnamed protein product, partial [Thelazia callipaeda]|uniref:NR LBD domain-containing protein n=1 Tax=Thelazia callipaeda TaxID=103827 RepID=A0A0N5CS19_THECL